MFLNHMARLTAIMLSVAAGVISVIGLASIFSGSYWEVIIIASLLEISKVIAATWLHSSWNTFKSVIKIYLSVAVVVLMGITSLGIYGFLARAHIKQQVAMETSDVTKLPGIEARIKIEREKIADIDKQVAQIDNALTAMTEKGRARDARNAITEANKQRQLRDSFLEQKAKSFDAIGQLEVEKVQIESKVKEFEVEVGPLKYIAQTIYGQEASREQFEKAVRLLILTLIFVFDPLAIALLVASNSFIKQEKARSLRYNYFKRYREKKKPQPDPDEPSPTPSIGNGMVINKNVRARKIRRRNTSKGQQTSEKTVDPDTTNVLQLQRPTKTKENTLDLSKTNIE